MPAALGGRPRVVRSFAVLTGSEFLSQAIAFAATAYLARILGRDGFGLWVFASALLTYLGFVVDAGTETWGTRAVSTAPERLAPTFVAVLRLRLVVAGGACTALVLATLAMAPDRRMALLFGTLTLFANAVQAPWALRGLERMVPVALGTLVQRAVLLLLALWWATGPGSARYATLWQAAGDIAAAALWLAFLLPMVRRSAAASMPAPSLRATLRQSWPFAAGRVLRGAMFALNIALLPLFRSDATAGVYGVANRLSVPLLVLSGLFGMSVFPAMVRACHLGGRREGEALDATFRVLAAIFVPVIVGMAALAAPIVTLGFTARYADAAGPLRILLAGMLCMVLSDNLRRVLHARGCQLTDFRLVAAAATAGVAFNVAGIAWYGAPGAACAVLASEALLLALVVLALPRTGADIRLGPALLRPLMASAIMAAAVLLLAALPLAARVLAGAAVYGAALLALGVRPLAEIRRVEAARSAADRADDRRPDPVDQPPAA